MTSPPESPAAPLADRASQTQIMRSTSIIGGSTAVSMILGIVRGKAIAIMVGPAGLGMIGILNNLMSTAANTASLGIGTSGVRRIAEVAAIGPDEVAATRRALVVGVLVLAVLGGVSVWLLRGILATHVLGDAGLATTVGWLALGVGLLIAASSQGALLNGLRRIGDIARVAIYSALLSAALGLAAIFAWGEAGIVAYLLAAPLSLFLVGHFFVSRLERGGPVTMAPGDYAREWRSLARLGIAFMLGGLVLGAGLLVIRARVQATLGLESLGLFEAAWAISLTYLGAVMGAMGTDFYPRLTALNGTPASFHPSAAN